MNTPDRFYRVSHSQLSIARHYGGVKVNGVYYVFDPTTDTLIREDVLKREQAAARQDLKARKTMAVKRQRKLFGEGEG